MNALADREILELFRERPDLLAVADAVSTTQVPAEAPRARRRMLGVALVPAVAAVAAVALLVIAAPWKQEQPSVDSRLFLQRALAVIGDRPVLHFAMQYASTNEKNVDLATGDEHPRVYRVENWLDARHHVVRSRFSLNGGPTADAVTHDVQGGVLDPAFAGFATQYRDALQSGRARIVGQTEVDGRPAVKIAFSPPNADWSEVATVDLRTFTPVAVVYSRAGAGSTLAEIRTIESLPYDPALFEGKVSTFPDLVTSQGGEISVAEARRILGHPPLGLPGRTPDSIERFNVTETLADGAKVDSAYVVLHYGTNSVTLARKWGAEALGFGVGNVTPPEGTIAVAGGDKSGLGWMKRDGVTVVLGVRNGDVLSVARSLTPLG
jgi:hypothetical protein